MRTITSGQEEIPDCIEEELTTDSWTRIWHLMTEPTSPQEARVAGRLWSTTSATLSCFQSYPLVTIGVRTRSHTARIPEVVRNDTHPKHKRKDHELDWLNVAPV